jgi:putative inorganic carbon (HCO3(-)) transporter
VLCVAVMLGLAGSQRLVSLLNLGEGTTFIRLKLWQAAVAMIRDHPLLGVGLDNFLYVYPDYILPEAWREPDLSHPHNLILDYWTRLGLGGVIVCLFLLVGFFRQSCQLYGDLPRGDGHAIILGTLAGMSAAVAHGLVDNFYFLVDLAFVYFAFMAIVRSWPGHPPAVQVPQADRDGVDDG